MKLTTTIYSIVILIISFILIKFLFITLFKTSSASSCACSKEQAKEQHKKQSKEGFSSLTQGIDTLTQGIDTLTQGIDTLTKGNDALIRSSGEYPISEDLPILEADYPLTGAKVVSNLDSQDIWWHQPVFGVGSFEQITNNIRYPKNPDNGTCTPANFCGALYKDKHNKSNFSKPLPPTPFGQGSRVNYYNSADYLLQFNNPGNMLY